jgi:hypothetical protein
MILTVLEDVPTIGAADDALGARGYMAHVVAFMFLGFFLGHFLGHTFIYTATFWAFFIEFFSLHFSRNPHTMQIVWYYTNCI